MPCIRVNQILSIGEETRNEFCNRPVTSGVKMKGKPREENRKEVKKEKPRRRQREATRKLGR